MSEKEDELWLKVRELSDQERSGLLCFMYGWTMHTDHIERFMRGVEYWFSEHYGKDE